MIIFVCNGIGVAKIRPGSHDVNLVNVYTLRIQLLC